MSINYVEICIWSFSLRILNDDDDDDDSRRESSTSTESKKMST